MFSERQMFERARHLIRLLHARAHRPDARDHEHVAALDFPSADRRNRRGLARENARPALVPVHAVRADDARIDRGGLHHAALGREVADGENHRAGESALLRTRGRQNHIVGIHTVEFAEQRAEFRAAFARVPCVEIFAKRAARRGEHAAIEQAERAEVEHHLGRAAGEEDAHGRMADGAIRQRVHETRRGAVRGDPVVHFWNREARGVCDGGDVEQQIRRAADGRVDDERVADGSVGEDVATAESACIEIHDGLRGTHRDVEPHGLSARRERGVRQREAERLGDDLRRGRSAEELASAAGRGARTAAEFGGFPQRQHAV